MKPASPHSETAQQLERLRAQVAQDNPLLYRHWALYLQVLRESLGSAVERACFHLAVEVHPQRYRSLEAARRLELHRRMTSLVQRSCTLLTVEQLQALSVQMQRRRRREAQRAQRQWLQALQNQPESDPGHEASDPSSSPGPDGSIHLGLALPISSTLFGMDRSEPSWPTLSAGDAVEALPSDRGSSDPIASDRFLPDHTSAEQDNPAADLMAVFSRLLDEAVSTDSADQGSSDTDDGLLPTNPLALLRWLDALDTALARRLRHLSHALNVELVRLGLSRSLIPLRLLEAVAAGQLDSQAAAANLVRLSLPVPDGNGGALVETQALLIRQADLEADQPRLRTCRTRLQQVRQELRRMAQTYQRLEQRLQTQDAEQLWLNDHSTAQTSRRQPPT